MKTVRELRHRFAVLTIGLLLIVAAGCGDEESFASDGASGSDPIPEPTATVTAGDNAATSTPSPLGPDAAMRQDAQMYADDYGISIEEAIERLEWQGDLGSLNGALEANEPDTFAGAFIEHEPQYRFVVLFTHDGEETIRKYVDEGSDLDEIVEVRTARYTMAELQDAQLEAIDLVRQVDTRVSSGINVWENQVEVYVFDAAEFQSRLDDAGITLPEGVALVEEGNAPEPASDPTPVAGIYFPLEKPSSGPRAVMEALLIGELIVEDGCLRVRHSEGSDSVLPVWPPDHRLRAEGDKIEVLNGDGEVVARVGDPVNMGGGEAGVSDPETLSENLREPIPDTCTGPFWIVGDTYPLGTGPGS